MVGLMLTRLRPHAHRHGAMKYISARNEILAQPDHARDVVVVEDTTERDGRRRTFEIVLLVPAPDVRRIMSGQQTKDVRLMHGWTRGLDANHTLPLPNRTTELEAKVGELHRHVRCRRSV